MIRIQTDWNLKTGFQLSIMCKLSDSNLDRLEFKAQGYTKNKDLKCYSNLDRLEFKVQRGGAMKPKYADSNLDRLEFKAWSHSANPSRGRYSNLDRLEFKET